MLSSASSLKSTPCVLKAVQSELSGLTCKTSLCRVDFSNRSIFKIYSCCCGRSRPNKKYDICRPRFRDTHHFLAPGSTRPINGTASHLSIAPHYSSGDLFCWYKLPGAVCMCFRGISWRGWVWLLHSVMVLESGYAHGIWRCETHSPRYRIKYGSGVDVQRLGHKLLTLC